MELTDKLFRVCEIQLCYRPEVKPSERLKISSSKDAYDIFYRSWDKDKMQLLEQAKLLLLNRANKVLGIVEISSGGIDGTVIDQRLIYAAALKAGAVSIILTHVHPSGNLLPSEVDKHITRQIAEGCKILGLRLFDHLIITAEGFTSFADEGLL